MAARVRATKAAPAAASGPLGLTLQARATAAGVTESSRPVRSHPRLALVATNAAAAMTHNTPHVTPLASRAAMRAGAGLLNSRVANPGATYARGG